MMDRGDVRRSEQDDVSLLGEKANTDGLGGKIYERQPSHQR